MLSLLDNITGQSFIEYVSAHCGIADTFSLTKNEWSTAEKSLEHSAVLKALAPHYIKTVYTNRWFCHCVPDGYKMEVYLFHFTPESKKFCSLIMIAFFTPALYGVNQKIYVFLKIKN